MMTLDRWSRLSAREQIASWLAVPEAESARYLSSAREGARLVLTVDVSSCAGATAEARVMMVEALMSGDWVHNAAELSDLRNDSDFLGAHAERLREFHHARINWRQGLDPTIEWVWPANRLVATKGRMLPGTKDRWIRAGGRVYRGKLIALKRDPVWSRFSLYGHPHPPFDDRSHGLDVEDVGAEEAQQLGLI